MSAHALPAATINDLPAVEYDASGDAVPVKSYAPTKWDILILGITIGLGGQYFSWNSGLHAGLYTFMIDYVVVGCAYITLCCCTSEITGALPFAGGAYGLSRCTLGYYIGFLIGCAEACEYIAYVSTSVMSLANMLVEIVPALKGYEPLIWLLVYGHSCYVHYRGDRFFWRWNLLIGSLSFILVVLYIAGSIPHVSFSKHADTDPDFRFVNGIDGFISSLPVACWFFVGVEALSLASDDVKDPTREIPFAQLACISTLSLIGVVVFFITVSLPPPGLNQVAKLLAPFDNGFHNMFDISIEMSTLFSIPAMYATTFGFMWGYGKLISAMATSKLLPPVLARRSDKYDTPINAVLGGTVLSYLFSLIVFFNPTIEQYLYNVCIAAAFLGYAGQCIGYISLKRFYPALKNSTFQSPFGIPGAVFSLLVWMLGLVSVACFQDRHGIEFSGFAGLIVLLSVFYVVYAKKHQTFSEPESKVFLMAHVMHLNRRKVSKRQLVEKNSPRKRHRHLNAKHTPVVHAEPVDGTVEEIRKTTGVNRLTSPFGSSAALRDPGVLKLPVAKWLDDATPFYRYFSNPKLVEIEYELQLEEVQRADVPSDATRCPVSSTADKIKPVVGPGVVTPVATESKSQRVHGYPVNEDEGTEQQELEHEQEQEQELEQEQKQDSGTSSRWAVTAVHSRPAARLAVEKK